MSHRLALAAALALAPVAGAAQNSDAALIDSDAIHSCFARASHILIREGARQVTASGPLRAQRTGRSWRITGDLRAPGAREGLIRLSCAVGAGWTSVELEMS